MTHHARLHAAKLTTRNEKEQAPQLQEPPVNPRHLVTLEAKQPFRKGDRDSTFVQVIRAAGSGKVCEVDVRTTMITFNLRSRAAVERVLAAVATLNSEPLVVYDGRKPRKPPGVRVHFFGTPEDIKGAIQGVRHVEPNFYVDEHGTKTSARMTSCAAWLEPDSKVLSRRVKMGDCEAIAVDPRQPPRKRHRKRSKKGKKGKKDKGKEPATTATSDMETTTGSGPSSPVLTEPTSWPTSASPPSAAPSKPQSPYAIVHLPGQEKQTEDE